MGAVKREVRHLGKLYSAVSRLHLCAVGWSPVRAGSCRGVQNKRQLWLRELERYTADQMSDTSTDSDRSFKCKMSYLVLVDFFNGSSVLQSWTFDADTFSKETGSVLSRCKPVIFDNKQ